MNLKTELNKIAKQAKEALQDVTNPEDLEQLKNDILGRKGELAKAATHIKEVAEKQKPVIGKLMNEVKEDLSKQFNKVSRDFQKAAGTRIDITQPGNKIPRGHKHPLTIVRERVAHIFETMGFSVTDGDELTSEFFCFETLNIPPTHPARDIQDTFFVKGKQDGTGRVMRTHTSSMQVPWMRTHTPPTRAVVIGRTFRNEATDASHEHSFHQIEGFVVDKGITAANLKHTLKTLLSHIMEKEVEVRFRPSYFPFVEPGYELDMSCLVCDGEGCSVCKRVGWIELLGCGMIHPNVLEHAGYNKGEYTGFAFGVGLERLAMMRYGIEDIRLFHSGDLAFLNQF